MQSLIYFGLTNCYGGFGSTQMERSCNACNGGATSTADGALAFSPQSNSTTSIVSELDLLLTGGRLNERSKEIISHEHDQMLATTDWCACQHSGRTTTPRINALHVAQMLFMSTAEFHSSNIVASQPTTRTVAATIQSQNRPYRAVVVVFLNGGCDSFNVLVPHSGCTANNNKDMYDEYGACQASYYVF